MDIDTVNNLQRIAVQESRLGIPLLVGRDVIHGFKTIFPIPLGQAATWNPDLVQASARVAALEASTAGVNWTFAPMIDVTRDPRWGRIAESLGEDPYLCSQLGAAMVKGFQGEQLDQHGSIAACAKHFAGYGAVEAGLDYNTTSIPEIELRNVYLPPFLAAIRAGVATVMASFTDLNGVPATANQFLMQQVLKEEWNFKGFVVSDWDSVAQLTVHGFTANDADAALAAASSGINMEMNSRLYDRHLGAAVASSSLTEAQLDDLVYPILKTKFQLGLFENAYRNPDSFPELLAPSHRELAHEAASQSCVLLKNTGATLPLDPHRLTSLAVIGPLADDGYEQLGTWIFDGEAEHSVTCLRSLEELAAGRFKIHYAQGVSDTRSYNTDGFEKALAAVAKADAAVMFIGEESILSGEAHCRADINLPGVQAQLIDTISALGKPTIAVIMAGRPLTLTNVIDKLDALLYAWHPGTMAGPAIADLLFGIRVPAGKLPISFPRMVGQVPIYYARKNTGKPATEHNITSIEEITGRAPQTSLGMSAFHLDAGFTPLFPFGYGLSYCDFRYSDLSLSSAQLEPEERLAVSATLHNSGDREAEEVVQLYVKDMVGSVTRPVKELKGFQRHLLQPGEYRRIEFTLQSQDLAFSNRHMQWVAEPGDFRVWIGGDSRTELYSDFRLLAAS